MKANSIRLIIALFTLALVFQGCFKEPVKVGLLIHSLEIERWEKDRDYIIQEIENAKGEVLVKVADGDAKKQLAQATELLSANVDVLIVIPVNQFTAAEIVDKAHQKGVKVISYDRLIRNCKLDYYVSTDNIRIGEMQAEYLTTVKPQGNYALIGGSVYDNNSQFLYMGQMNILQPLVEKGDIKIVYNEFTQNWSEEEGYTHMMNCLNVHSVQPDVVIAGNDALALGVIRAFKEKGINGKVLVAGQDAALQNIQEIIMGNQTITIYKPIQSLAAATAQLAMRLGKDKSVDPFYSTISNGEKLVPCVLLEAMVVHKDNLKLTVISEGFQKEEDIFGKK
ncbi:sugar ABC transporter substrate-binding protein [Puteibacter caeruleilacunae]|nr:sugar ABC transporter substrate-binding protein [Puteibacter caeruleilacunae]